MGTRKVNICRTCGRAPQRRDWLCDRLRSSEYYDKITADLQRLHAIVGGIVADGRVTENELHGLSQWLADNDHLKTCWLHDEIDSLVTSVMADCRIDEGEHKMLAAFFSGFVTMLDDRTVSNPPVAATGSIVGLCAVCPEIEFAGGKFCVTGVIDHENDFHDAVADPG